MTTINQKEYLKRYLSIGSEPGKKKKRKKAPKTANRIKIIDYDDEVKATFTAAVEEDLYGTAEDAPQIVGITDDRPLELRANDYKISEMWKPLGGSSGDQSNKQPGPSKLSPNEKDDQSPPTRIKQESEDGSPPRRNRSPDEDASPPRKHRRKGSDGPPRRTMHEDDKSRKFKEKEVEIVDGSPIRRIKREKDDDQSPPRKGRGKSIDDSLGKSSRDDDESPPRKNMKKYDDMSPPRRNRKKNDDGSSPNSNRRRNIESPIRKTRKDEDMSPPRRNKYNSSPPRRDKVRQMDSPLRRSRKDEDMSPPRRNHRNISPPSNSRNRNTTSPARKSGKSENRNINDEDSLSKKDENRKMRKDNDMSPPRRNKRNDDSSPSRNLSERNIRSSVDNSPPRKSRKTEGDSSPPRRREEKTRSPKRKSRWDRNPSPPKIKKERSPSPKAARMLKTLDGKKAGLQSAQELIIENQALKKRESELFKKMSEEASGVGASTIVRDRKTGKIRDFDREAQDAKKKKEEEDKRVEKYAVWGKGVKQTEDNNEKIAQDLYEMSKPLARYADDEDLERYLKEQEREGDPMLAYIRKKKRKQAVIEGKPTKPEYMGEFMPNRYGIRPGHRWDGVDRSNGYEKKWFETINKKKALQEDSYRWNSEDM